MAPAKGIRWLMADGTLEPVRCGASNRCDYCAMHAALEAALVLKLDAQMRRPTVGLTTTTRRPGYSMPDFRKAEQALWRQLRRELEPTGVKRQVVPREQLLEYCGFVEWTTGAAADSGGVRRPHCHHLTKGIDPGSDLLAPIPFEDVPADHPLRSGRPDRERTIGGTTNELELRVSQLWHKFTGDAFIVECRPLRTAAGAIAYLALHHHKKTQAPPAGFNGRRLRPSKGYYEQPIAELRRLARELVQEQRVEIVVKRAIRAHLYFDEEEEFEADAALTSALVHGLRSLAREPLELQVDLDGEMDWQAEQRELVRRTGVELQRLRAESPPELVRVRERDEVDEQTGITYRRATAVLGAMEPKPPRPAPLAARGSGAPALGEAA